MKILKTLHLASFDGNIGDNANHSGFYQKLRENKFFKFDIDELEIREFYWKQKYFDKSFVNLVNSYDLLIIGGGNYFELWVEDSPTGTSIAIELDLFRKINIPILFNALGVDTGQGVSKNNLIKFRSFMSIITNNTQYLVSIRNDGAKESIEKFVGECYLSNIMTVPDGGFNIDIEDNIFYKKKKYICINIANDMVEARFPNGNNYINYDRFISDFSNFIKNFLKKNIDIEIVFIPHIFRDLDAINDILKLLPDEYRRRNISVAALLHGKEAVNNIFGLYKYSLFNLCMRFHSNVCSIAQQTPTIGLCNYRQIEKLYEELECSDMIVEVNTINFSDKLLLLIDNLLNNYQEVTNRYRVISNKQKYLYDNYHIKIREWINTNYV